MVGSFRKFLQTVLPESMSQEMERESRLWMIQCPHCKYERSIWELGGIRWKAAGNPRRYMRCPNCNQVTFHLIYKKNG